MRGHDSPTTNAYKEGQPEQWEIVTDECEFLHQWVITSSEVELLMV